MAGRHTHGRRRPSREFSPGHFAGARKAKLFRREELVECGFMMGGGILGSVAGCEVWRKVKAKKAEAAVKAEPTEGPVPPLRTPGQEVCWVEKNPAGRCDAIEHSGNHYVYPGWRGLAERKETAEPQSANAAMLEPLDVRAGSLAGTAVGMALVWTILVIRSQLAITVQRYRLVKERQRRGAETLSAMERLQRDAERQRGVARAEREALASRPCSSIALETTAEFTALDWTKEREERRRQLEMELEGAIRPVCGRRCSPGVAAAIAFGMSGRRAAALLAAPGELGRMLIENRKLIDGLLGEQGLRTEDVLTRIEERKDGRSITLVPEMKPPVPEVKAEADVPGPAVPAQDPKLQAALEILRHAKENSRGIDRKEFREIIRSAGFATRNGNKHIKITYEGEITRTADGRAILMNRGTGTLAHGTVNRVLENLMAFLERRNGRPAA